MGKRVLELTIDIHGRDVSIGELLADVEASKKKFNPELEFSFTASTVEAILTMLIDVLEWIE